MIVKNEAPVIRRCIESIRQFIDYVVICDTGSTDGTQDIIRDILKDVPGELHERPWKNFGHNRTECLDLARGKADYILIMDADEILEPQPGFEWPDMDRDCYTQKVDRGESNFASTRFLSGKKPWHYVGVLHEFPECLEQPATQGHLEGLVNKSPTGGARSKDPLTYAKDAAVLEQGLIDEPNNSRYVFYLAQSYRDSGESIKAYEAYKKRIPMGGWSEEVWYSMLQAAWILEFLNQPEYMVVAAYLDAYEFRPCRAESLYALGRYYRFRKEKYNSAYMFLHRAAQIPFPVDDSLFVDVGVYQWRLSDELSLAAHHTGRYAEAIQLEKALLECGHLPESEVERIKANIQFATNGLG